VTLGTERPPVRPRSGRHPVPPLIFLLVLALIALGVWWMVLQQDNARQDREAAACSSAEAAPPSLDPSTVSVRVLNATEHAGLAQTVANQLKQRGFKIDEVGNDRGSHEVTGTGEVRYGPRGREAARYLRVYLAGAEDDLDTRATSQVDLVLGPEFKSLATADEVKAALSSAASASGAC